MSKLREIRKRRLYSQEELAELVGVSPLTLRRWEAGRGQQPQPLHLRRLSEILEATPIELGLVSPDHGWNPVNDALEMAALAGASEVAESTVETTLEAVDRLRRSYSRTPPTTLILALQSRLQALRKLLDGRLRLGQRRELLDAAGWLSLLLGTVYFDIDQSEPAHAWREAALLLGQEVGDLELQAWAWETPSWFAFAEQRYQDSVELADRGLALAPQSSVAVALHLQQARAWARLHDNSAGMAAIRRSAAALEPLTTPEHLDDHYVFDPAKSDYFVGTAYALMGLARPAEHHARLFIAQAGLVGSRNYWPIRVSSARMDLGFALAQQGKVDEAAHEAALGFDVPILHRGTLRRASELEQVLNVHGEVREVRDFREQLSEAWHRLP
jgi:transcriptional regulator with XRE-family HTH domain